MKLEAAVEDCVLAGWKSLVVVKSKELGKDSSPLDLEPAMDASFDHPGPGLSVLGAGDLVEEADSKGSVKDLSPPDLGLVKDASLCSLLELGLSEAAGELECTESGFGAVKDLVEVVDNEGPAVKGSLPADLEIFQAPMMVTGKYFAELEELVAPALAEKDCIEHGIAAGRDSAEVEDSKGPVVATDPMATELSALKLEIGRRSAGSGDSGLSFEWEVVLVVVEAHTAPVKDLAVVDLADLEQATDVSFDGWEEAVDLFQPWKPASSAAVAQLLFPPWPSESHPGVSVVPL